MSRKKAPKAASVEDGEPHVPLLEYEEDEGASKRSTLLTVCPFILGAPGPSDGGQIAEFALGARVARHVRVCG